MNNFKVGDVVNVNSLSNNYFVRELVFNSRAIRGKWSGSVNAFIVPDDSYLLEEDKTGHLHFVGFSDEYKLTKVSDASQKFQPGDVITNNAIEYKVEDVVFSPRCVDRDWHNGSKGRIILANQYLVSDNNSRWHDISFGVVDASFVIAPQNFVVSNAAVQAPTPLSKKCINCKSFNLLGDRCTFHNRQAFRDDVCDDFNSI